MSPPTTGPHPSPAREALFRRLSEGATLLTPGARLSRSLREAYGQWQRDQGRQAWTTPAILPWQSWLEQLWEEATLTAPRPLPLLLEAHQARLLWKQAIRDSGTTALHPGALVDQLQKSWQRLHDWRLSPDDSRLHDDGDAGAFRELAGRFRRLCRQRDAITPAELPARLAEALGDLSVSLPASVELVGFQLLTPAQAHFLEVLEAQGVAVRHHEPDEHGGRALRCPAADPRQELALACTWARRALLENPSRRLAIVVPDLQRRRAEVAHQLDKVLEPSALLPGAEPRRRVWNLSLGRPLAEHAPVRTALDLLSLMQGPAGLERVEALLRSPWIAGGDEERFRRAQLVRRLRDTGRPDFRLGDLLHHATAHDPASGEPRPWHCPRLAEALSRLKKLRQEGPGACSPSAWVDHFVRWLEAAGWMAQNLDSHHYQVLERWKRLLGSFRALDLVTQRMTLGEALGELSAMARATLFQPRTPPAPLQVLGLYEVTGLEFDGLWVLGLHEAAWPASPPPDPFLPLSLQRELGMPGADPGRELELARRWTAALENAAQQVIFSHPLTSGSEPLAPSPLLAHCPETSAAELGLDPSDEWEARIRAEAALEPLHPDPAPPVAGRVSGGAGLFRHQAACPFRAFAEHRLGAAPFPAVHPGLDAAQRGSLLHRTLEILWGALGDQATLLALDEAALAREVDNAVSAALADLERHQPGLLGPRARNLEARRLSALVWEWLELEKQRTPFRVAARELRVTGRSGPVEYRLFIDRVDELEDGRRILIDYKTGRVSPAGWFGERPDDPQLPLYSTVLEEAPLAGVAFAQLRADGTGFRGVVAEEKLLPGLPARHGQPEVRQAMADWPGTLERWRSVIDALASEFARGEAQVDPKKGSRTCEELYCELAPLCRIHTVEEEAGDE